MENSLEKSRRFYDKPLLDKKIGITRANIAWLAAFPIIETAAARDI